VFAFHMPPDDVSEQLDTNSFSNNMSLLQPAPGHSQNRLKSTKPELSRPKSGKRRRIGEKCPDLNSVTLMKEVLQSGGTVSPELLARIQRSVDEEERSHHPSQATRSSRPRRQETKSASSNFKPSPFTGMGPQSMNLHLIGRGQVLPIPAPIPPHLLIQGIR
jgi:hypothetical protein